MAKMTKLEEQIREAVKGIGDEPGGTLEELVEWVGRRVSAATEGSIMPTDTSGEYSHIDTNRKGIQSHRPRQQGESAVELVSVELDCPALNGYDTIKAAIHGWMESHNWIWQCEALPILLEIHGPDQPMLGARKTLARRLREDDIPVMHINHKRAAVEAAA